MYGFSLCKILNLYVFVKFYKFSIYNLLLLYDFERLKFPEILSGNRTESLLYFFAK